MNKFRFHVHTWSPQNGHKDRRIIIRGSEMRTALQMMIKVLESQTPGIIVTPKFYETLEK